MTHSPAQLANELTRLSALLDQSQAALVDAVREEWLVADRWWTEEPLRRRYFDIVLETGEHVSVFHDEERGGWFRQKA